MHKLKIFLLCFFYFFTTATLNNAHASNERFLSLNIEKDLPYQSVYNAFQQRNGFIWLATDRGAIRYDGKSFRHFFYSPGSPNHITHNFVIQVFEDNLGNIWILTEYGLNKVAPTGIIEYFLHDEAIPDSINSNWLHFIYQDSTSRIWIGTNQGLNLYQPETNSFAHVDGKIKNTPYNIAVLQMQELSSDNFILGTLEGLAFFNPSKQSFVLEHDTKKNIPEWYQDTILAITPSQTGRMLIGTESQGLIDFDPQSREFTHYKAGKDGSSISDNNITSIIERKSGEIWLGHIYAGITIISSNR